MANDINIVVSADARSATQNLQRAQNAVSDLDRRIKKSTQSVNRNANAYSKNAVATNKWAKGALQQAGYQVGDFAVQVGGGTNALQAFGQQGAQLAGIFGPIGAVVGAGIAIFAAFGVAIQKTAEAAEEASGKAKTFTDQMALLEAATSKLNDTQILSTGNLEAIREKYGALTSDLKEFLLLQRESALIETTKQLGLSFEKILNTQEYQTALKKLGGVKSDLQTLQEGLALELAQGIEKADAQTIAALNDEIGQMQIKFAAVRKEVEGLPEAKLLAFSDAFMEAADAKSIEGMKSAIVGVREQVTGLPVDARNALMPMILQMEGQIRTLSVSMGKSFKDVRNEVLSVVEAQYLLNNGTLPPQAAADLIKYKDLYKDIRKAIRSATDEAITLGKTTLTNIQAQLMGDRGLLPPQAMEDFKIVNKELERFYDRLRARRRKESADAESASGKAQNAARQRAEELEAINEKMLEPMRKLAELQRELAIRQSGGGDLGVRMAKAADGAKALAREQGTLDPTKLQEIADAAAAVERSTFFAENSISALAQNGAKALKNELDPAIQQIKSATEAIGSAFENSFTSVIDGTMSVKDAFKSMALSIINDLFRIFVVKQITGFISNAIGSLFGPIDTTITPGVGNSNGLPASFNGGGYTGNGARAGGLDGKGGRMAMIHPRETILDHTKGQGQGVTVVQNINVSAGVAQTVRAEMTTMLPQIGEYAKAAVLDARKRGGAYGGAFA
jgi:hypothetical protein